MYVKQVPTTGSGLLKPSESFIQIVPQTSKIIERARNK